jgi:hypothetical protein
MKRRFRKMLLCLVLCAGSSLGLPMRADEIEELMRTMNQPKIVRKFAEEEERGDAPPPTAESRTS